MLLPLRLYLRDVVDAGVTVADANRFECVRLIRIVSMRSSTGLSFSGGAGSKNVFTLSSTFGSIPRCRAMSATEARKVIAVALSSARRAVASASFETASDN